MLNAVNTAHRHDAGLRYFGPGATEIAEAESIVAAFAAPQAQGLGVIEIGGRMVERLHLEQAERLMHKVRQSSARKDIA